jgi:uncharacterized protein
MSTSDQKPISYSAPRILGDQAGFWEAAKAGRFLIKRCKDCAKAHWFPRALCPFCMGETDWEEASGRVRFTPTASRARRFLSPLLLPM